MKVRMYVNMDWTEYHPKFETTVAHTRVITTQEIDSRK